MAKSKRKVPEITGAQKQEQTEKQKAHQARMQRLTRESNLYGKAKQFGYRLEKIEKPTEPTPEAESK
jgi:hypothetical protein